MVEMRIIFENCMDYQIKSDGRYLQLIVFLLVNKFVKTTFLVFLINLAYGFN
jgi:hypothetical protein